VIERENMLNEDWTTYAVTALPLGWINVFEHAAKWAAKSGAWFSTDMCPALLLQERADTNGDRLTRVVFAQIVDGELEPAVPDEGLRGIVASLTEQEWERIQPEEEKQLLEARAILRQTMLDRLAEAGPGGIKAGDLVKGLAGSDRRVDVREVMIEQGEIKTRWEDDARAVGGRVCWMELP